MRIAIEVNRDDRAWSGQQLFETQTLIPRALESPCFDEPLHVQEREATTDLHLDWIGAPQHALGDELFRDRIILGKGLGSLKGAKAAEMAAVVQKEIFKDELGDRDTLVFRARETRETTYANATTIVDLMMAQLQIAQKNPAQAFKAATAVKMLSLAAATLERVQAVKLRALGLDKENALPDEFPVLTFRDITSTELEALHARDEDDEEDGFGGSIVPISSADTETAVTESDESDNIVVEGEELEEQEELEKTRADSLHSLGGRLVKGQLP